MMMLDERVYWMMDECRRRGTSYMNDLSKASFAYAETVILTWNACHIGMIACRNSAGRWYSAMKSLSKWHALRVIMT